MQVIDIREKVRNFDLQWFVLLGIGFYLLGFFFSRAFMSTGMLILLGQALVNPDLPANVRRLFRQPVLLLLIGIFFLYVFSGINSDDHSFWLQRVRMKLPFLGLPLAVVSFPRFSAKLYFRVLGIFFWLTVLLSVHSLILFLTDMERITELYQRGQVMPTPIFHIRFSLMVAFSVAIAWYFYQEGVVMWKRWERFPMLLAALFLVFYLHLLAVRSGLLALYAIAAFFFIREIISRRRYALGIALAAFLALSVWISYRWVPTLQNKINYTIYSVELFFENRNLEELSDSYRLGSLWAGWALFRAHPWVGTGIGDLKTEMDRYFHAYFPALEGFDLMPHNQYLLVLAATGLLGFTYFTFATLYPLFSNRRYRDALFVAFHLLFLLSAQVEHPLETQLGTGFYLFFLLLGIRYLDQKKKGLPAANANSPLDDFGSDQPS